MNHEYSLSPDHGTKFLNNFLPVLLDPYCSRVSRRMSVHAANNSCDTWFLVVSCRWVCNVSPKEYNRFVKHLGSYTRYQYAVYSTQFHVYLKTQIRQCLG